jgi:hypothetical protein
MNIKPMILIIFFAITFHKTFSQEGSTVAQFLKIPVDARGGGMGEAMVAVANDPSSMFWNPAGLGRLNNLSVMFTHTFWFAEIDHDYIAFAIPFGENALGLSITTVNVGDIEITTLEQPNGTGTFYTASDLSLGLTFARQMTDRLSVGVTLKYVREQIVNEVADGFAFDVGTTLDVGDSGFRLAMALTNFGFGLQMEGEDLVVPYFPGPANTPIKSYLETLQWPLPTNFRLGISYELVGPESFLLNSTDNKFLIAIDGNHPVDAVERANFGAEYSFKDIVFFRGGYKYRYSEQTFSFGGGLIIPMGESSITAFDYSISDYGLLDYIHRISLQFQF